jgi:RNA polymerase sigma-70 factor, ECF subfamily
MGAASGAVAQRGLPGDHLRSAWLRTDSRPTAGYDVDTLAADLDLLLGHLGLTDVVLVGLSLGSGEFARYLASYGSAQVSKAVMLGAIPPFLLDCETSRHRIEVGWRRHDPARRSANCSFSICEEGICGSKEYDAMTTISDTERSVLLDELGGRVDAGDGDDHLEVANAMTGLPLGRVRDGNDRSTVDPASESDAALADRFERDVIPLMDQLYSGALHLARNRQEAEDLLQETMLRAYVGFRSFRLDSNVKAWLYRILHNTWINAYRKRQRRPVEVSMEPVSDRPSPRLRSAEVEALEGLPDEDIQAALLSQPDEFRLVVYFAGVENLSCAEIADIMGTPKGTVMSRLHRARTRLRESLLVVATERRMLCPPDHDEVDDQVRSVHR